MAGPRVSWTTQRGPLSVILTTRIRYHTGAIDGLDQAIEHAHEAQTERDQYLKQHYDEMQELPHVEHAINRRFGQLVRADVADPPAYHQELGAPPKDPAALARWRAAVDYVERYRVDHYIKRPSPTAR